ncbi:dihydroneopterin aldolase [Fodinicurvata halophila]|uniref:dihydroneopterin aldolase n=1 Tax=Fodinicurvata halophila TaxID=1419723 RepID=A0ABV8UHC5_9PROT
MSFSADETGHTRMFLQDVLLNLKVGIEDWERHPDKRQRVLVDVDCYMRQERHEGTSINDVLDYNRIYDYLMTWQERSHTDLLETLAEELADVCFQDTRVVSCRVRLRKPDIYWNVGAAGIEFYRTRSTSS